MLQKKIDNISDICLKINSLSNILYGYSNYFGDESEEVFNLIESVTILRELTKELNSKVIEISFQEFS